jgi:hypothetical protein
MKEKLVAEIAQLSGKLAAETEQGAIAARRLRDVAQENEQLRRSLGAGILPDLVMVWDGLHRNQVRQVFDVWLAAVVARWANPAHCADAEYREGFADAVLLVRAHIASERASRLAAEKAGP